MEKLHTEISLELDRLLLLRLSLLGQLLLLYHLLYDCLFLEVELALLPDLLLLPLSLLNLLLGVVKVPLLLVVLLLFLDSLFRVLLADLDPVHDALQVFLLDLRRLLLMSLELFFVGDLDRLFLPLSKFFSDNQLFLEFLPFYVKLLLFLNFLLFHVSESALGCGLQLFVHNLGQVYFVLDVLLL